MKSVYKYIALIILSTINLSELAAQHISDSTDSLSIDSISSANNQEADTLSWAADVVIPYSKYYYFLNYEHAFIEWTDSTAVVPFLRLLDSTKNRKVKVLHIGDSHLQADIYTGYVRDRIQEHFGTAGRGMVFPYSAAGTHSAYDYRTYSGGEWEYSRNVLKESIHPIAISGATIHTKDSSAWFSFVFRKKLQEDFNRIKLYYKASPESYDLLLITGAGDDTLKLVSDTIEGFAFFNILLDKATDTLNFFIHENDSNQSFFECYGMMIENPEDKGLLYSSVGINGAGFRALLTQTLFSESLREYDPDLVILDVGANDFYRGGLNKPVFTKQMKQVIDSIRFACPETSIILTNSQDIYHRRRNIIACKTFSEISREIAAEKNCGLYDYYQLAGDRYSMMNWLQNGLAKRDKVHLSTPGYQLKGKLLLNAIFNSLQYAREHQYPDSLIADSIAMDTIALAPFFPEGTEFSKKPKLATKTYEVPAGEAIYYKIRSGDNLGSIAERYGVRVSDLQRWNGLSGSRIIAGETLIIYGKKAKQQASNTKPKSSTKPKTTTTPKTTARKGGKLIARYKVKTGDSLWSIAVKYKTSVDKIKLDNNLKNDRLDIGQVLLIKKHD